jgi:hypothetical protein
MQYSCLGSRRGLDVELTWHLFHHYLFFSGDRSIHDTSGRCNAMYSTEEVKDIEKDRNDYCNRSLAGDRVAFCCDFEVGVVGLDFGVNPIEPFGGLVSPLALPIRPVAEMSVDSPQSNWRYRRHQVLVFANS